MSDKDRGDVDLSLITQAAVGYVRDNSSSKEMAKKFVAEVRVHLGQILAQMDGTKDSPLGKQASPEAVALMKYVAGKKETLQKEKGYKSAQASAIVIKDDLVPLQVVAGMANDADMLASVRKVNSQVISDLGADEEQAPTVLMRRKKRGRAPGSGKKPK